MTEQQWVDADRAQRRAASAEERQARRAAGRDAHDAAGTGAAPQPAVDRDLDTETADEMLSEAHTAGD